MGFESHLEDGASAPSLKQREKTARNRDTRHMETKNLETGRRKAKYRTGTGIIKTTILEYNMTGMLTDERGYGNSDPK